MAMGRQGATTVIRAIEVFVLQVCILGNHLNGKDTHIRCLKVFGPPGTGVRQGTQDLSMSQTVMSKRLVQQGMQTEAFRRQAERVGYDRALSQLERIMQKSSRNVVDIPPAPPVQSNLQRSLLTLAHTLR